LGSGPGPFQKKNFGAGPSQKTLVPGPLSPSLSEMLIIQEEKFKGTNHPSFCLVSTGSSVITKAFYHLKRFPRES